MGDPDSLISILWSSDPAAARAVWGVLGATTLALLLVHLPLGLRLFQLLHAERRLDALLDDDGHGRGSERIAEVLRDSPAAAQFDEFDRRWSTAQLDEARDRSPVRLMDVFDDHPLLAPGPRRSLLPVIPGVLTSVGLLIALTGLIPALGGGAPDALAGGLGVALRAGAWGFLGAVVTAIVGRVLEGGFDARSAGLDRLVERAYGSVSPGELAEITRKTQQRSLETLGKELTQFADELNERLDRGLQRIEQSSARAASLVSQEQRGALHTVVQELSLSVRQGVEHHLAELRGALQRAIDHQSSVTGGLAETFERMVENSETQDRVARSLLESASAVDEAARAMSGTAGEMRPVLDHLGTTSRALADTADRIGETQGVVARAAEGVRSALDLAAGGVDEQRDFIERSLVEIRQALAGLGDGLGDSLQRSLREVDDVLGSTVGQLRQTLAESNETIERLAGPIRAAEGTTRETHVALDRVRDEVQALAAWMSQAIKPVRSGLGDVEQRAEDITRAITEFSNHARQIDKSMSALRDEIHEESRRLQGAGSDLGRRLSQTTEAIGQLETTTSEATRRSRSVTSRDRPWARAPEARAAPSATRATKTARAIGRASTARPDASPRSHRPAGVPNAAARSPARRPSKRAPGASSRPQASDSGRRARRARIPTSASSARRRRSRAQGHSPPPTSHSPTSSSSPVCSVRARATRTTTRRKTRTSEWARDSVARVPPGPRADPAGPASARAGPVPRCSPWSRSRSSRSVAARRARRSRRRPPIPRRSSRHRSRRASAPSRRSRRPSRGSAASPCCSPSTWCRTARPA